MANNLLGSCLLTRSSQGICSVALWETGIPTKLAEIAVTKSDDKKAEEYATKAMVQLFQFDPQSIGPNPVHIPWGFQQLSSSHLVSKLGNIMMQSLHYEEPVLGATALMMALNNCLCRHSVMLFLHHS